MPQNSTRCWYSRRHREVAEDDQEDEQVVDRERVLDQVAGEELERRPAAEGPPQPAREERAPARRRTASRAPPGAAGHARALRRRRTRSSDQDGADDDEEERPVKRGDADRRCIRRDESTPTRVRPRTAGRVLAFRAWRSSSPSKVSTAAASRPISSARPRWLARARRAALVTHEPGGTPLGDAIRRVFLDRALRAMDGTVELLLVFASRRQHLLEVIEPALAAGRHVLCDRFTDSTRRLPGRTAAASPLETIARGRPAGDRRPPPRPHAALRPAGGAGPPARPLAARAASAAQRRPPRRRDARLLRAGARAAILALAAARAGAVPDHRLLGRRRKRPQGAVDAALADLLGERRMSGPAPRSRRALELARRGRLYPSVILHGGAERRAARRGARARPHAALRGADAAEARPAASCRHCRRIVGLRRRKRDGESAFHPDFAVLERDLKTVDLGRGDARVRCAPRTSSPFEARGQVFVVAAADTLSAEAADALLKALEEPGLGAPASLPAARALAARSPGDAAQPLAVALPRGLPNRPIRSGWRPRSTASAPRSTAIWPRRRRRSPCSTRAGRLAAAGDFDRSARGGALDDRRARRARARRSPPAGRRRRAAACSRWPTRCFGGPAAAPARHPGRADPRRPGLPASRRPRPPATDAGRRSQLTLLVGGAGPRLVPGAKSSREGAGHRERLLLMGSEGTST